MSTLQTTMAEGDNLKKYIHHVLNFDNSKKEVITGDYISAFYYSQDELIKVEESVKDRNGTFKLSWYFENNKVIKLEILPKPQGTDAAEKIKDRDKLLPVLSKRFLTTFKSRHPAA